MRERRGREEGKMERGEEERERKGRWREEREDGEGEGGKEERKGRWREGEEGKMERGREGGERGREDGGREGRRELIVATNTTHSTDSRYFNYLSEGKDLSIWLYIYIRSHDCAG